MSDAVRRRYARRHRAARIGLYTLALLAAAIAILRAIRRMGVS